MEDTRLGLKWSYHPEDVLAAWVAEMDFGLAPPIMSALHAAVDRGETGYPYPALEERLAKAAVGFWRDTFGWAVTPESVFSAPDVVQGVHRAIVHLTEPGTPVVMPTPMYFPLFNAIASARRELIEVPSTKGEDGRYRLPLEGIEKALELGAGAIVMCNPWNPVGRVLDRDEISELTAVASAHGARLISDEIHGAITYQGHDHLPAAIVDPANVITVTAASKAWNLPGLKCAQVILTNPDDTERWSSYFTPDKIGVGTFGLIASQAAYAEGVPWFTEVMQTLETNRKLLADLVETHLPEVRMRAPEGTYLAWLDFTDCGVGNPSEFCLEKARVAVTDGALFRGDGASHGRFNFATSQTNLGEMVERIATALKG